MLLCIIFGRRLVFIMIWGEAFEGVDWFGGGKGVR